MIMSCIQGQISIFSFVLSHTVEEGAFGITPANVRIAAKKTWALSFLLSPLPCTERKNGAFIITSNFPLHSHTIQEWERVGVYCSIGL